MAKRIVEVGADERLVGVVVEVEGGRRELRDVEDEPLLERFPVEVLTVLVPEDPQGLVTIEVGPGGSAIEANPGEVHYPAGWPRGVRVKASAIEDQGGYVLLRALCTSCEGLGTCVLADAGAGVCTVCQGSGGYTPLGTLPPLPGAEAEAEEPQPQSVLDDMLGRPEES